MLSLGLWRRRRSFFLDRLGGRGVLGLRINFFSLGLCFLCLSFNFLGLDNVLSLRISFFILGLCFLGLGNVLGF